jgi:hypothetical protein
VEVPTASEWPDRRLDTVAFPTDDFDSDGAVLSFRIGGRNSGGGGLLVVGSRDMLKLPTLEAPILDMTVPSRYNFERRGK